MERVFLLLPASSLFDKWIGSAAEIGMAAMTFYGCVSICIVNPLFWGQRVQIVAGSNPARPFLKTIEVCWGAYGSPPPSAPATSFWKGRILAVTNRWIEVDNDCFGPDKKNHHWQIILLISRCVSIKRKRLGNFIRRKRDAMTLEAKTKKMLLEKLEQFIEKRDVLLLE